MRVSLPFTSWPLELGKLLLPGITDAEKECVVDKFWALRECCCSLSDGFTWKLRQRMATRDDLTSQSTLDFLADVFSHVDASNIRTEDCFARARRHQKENEGPATFFAGHVLSEWSAVHETKKNRHGRNESLPVLRPKAVSR